MPPFCDVALAVPLDMAFTYAVPPGLVPFRQQRIAGVVMELHHRAPGCHGLLKKASDGLRG